jgi:hypothetical protein
MTGSTSLLAVGISYDKVSERVTLAFDKEIPTGEALLTIDFTATINEAMAGFSRCKYKAPVTPSSATPELDGFHYMMSTQFEACDARRAFPCFDEPNLKAEFDFEIEVPKDLVALSNMPVKSERDGSKDGWKILSFERTPVMSTYVSSSSLFTSSLANMNPCSSWRGQSVTSDTSKQRQSASTTELASLFGSIPPRVLKSKLGTPWSALIRLLTTSQNFSELSILSRSPIFSVSMHL